MNKQNLQALKGFRDFLPEEARKRQWLKSKMITVFEKWGYEPMETPTLEPLELFTGVIGEDEKLFFKFEDQGGRQVALRYDQTVPTIRALGENFDKLVFPFRRYQIQPAYRAEKPQKGRYREFIQSDLDIFGILSPLADAEVIAVTLDLYRELGFKSAVALVNSRTLMRDLPYEAIVAIDKLQKIGEEGVVNDMVAKGIEQNKAQEYFNYAKNLKPNDELITIFEYLEKSGFSKDWYRFEPTLARSFSYSEGPIWEIVIPEYPTGSVGGGERYDGLIEKITGRKLSGTGIGIGFDRTLEALEACSLLPEFTRITKVLVTVFSEDLFKKSLEIATLIRQAGINAETFPDPEVKFDKQLKYADKKGIPYVVIIGPVEAEKNIVKLKNMQTGEQEELTVEELVKKLQ
jgi:histidyl-tRNA synthetase